VVTGAQFRPTSSLTKASEVPSYVNICSFRAKLLIRMPETKIAQCAVRYVQNISGNRKLVLRDSSEQMDVSASRCFGCTFLNTYAVAQATFLCIPR
jgi:hypothetical protein